MSRTRTLAQLRSDVADRADITVTTSGRHTTVNVNRRINQAIQKFQRLVTEAGSPFYVKQSAVSTATSATVDTANWAPRDYLALPADFYHIVGIDLTVNGSTYSMAPYMTSERNGFRDFPAWMQANGVGTPCFYQVGGVNQAGSRVVKIIPSSDAVYSCVIWYLPVPPDLAADGDTFDGIAGYEEWVVNRAGMDSLLRDGTSPAYMAMAEENAMLERSMATEFSQAGGPIRRVDSRRARRFAGGWSRGFWGRS